MSVLTGQTLWKYSPHTQYRPTQPRDNPPCPLSPEMGGNTHTAVPAETKDWTRGGRPASPEPRPPRLEIGMAWIFWLVAAAGLGVAEFFTLTIGFGLIAAAAVVAAATAGLGAPLFIQVLAFVLGSAAGLLVVRPIALRHMTQPSVTREGSEALIGRKAVVMEDVTASDGLIKLSGEVWSARAFDETLVIPPGAEVDVMEIEGATAIVYPRELLP